MFLGMSGMDPSTAKCQDLLIKFELPQTKLSEINLEVQPQRLILQCPKFFINYYLPFKVKDKESSAKWVSDKEVLEVTLPMDREELLPF
jgi:dynein assembly factor 6, axonemal